MGCVVRWIVAAVVVSLLMVAGAVGLVLVIRSVERPAEPTKVSPPPVQPRPVRKQSEPKPAEPEPAPAPPAKKERPSFDADWGAAGVIIAGRRKGWEQRAEKAMRILTADERFDAGLALRDAAAKPEAMAYQEHVASLAKFGLGDAVRAISSGWAVGDKDFRRVAQRTWTADSGAAGIVDLAERWGQLNDAERDDVARAVAQNVPTADLPTDIRDAMLKAGLRRWLAR